MDAYATSADLTGGDWLDTPPANVDRFLRSATVLVARACNVSPYDAPAADAVTPLRDATCAQVASWVALGVDPAKAGTDMPGPVRKSSILDGSIERDTSAASKALEECLDGLCSEAEAILLQAGLLFVAVPLADTSGALPSWGLDYPRSYADCGDWRFV